MAPLAGVLKRSQLAAGRKQAPCAARNPSLTGGFFRDEPLRVGARYTDAAGFVTDLPVAARAHWPVPTVTHSLLYSAGLVRSHDVPLRESEQGQRGSDRYNYVHSLHSWSVRSSELVS